MALTYSEAGKLGQQAQSFQLPGVDGRVYSLNDFSGAKVLVIVFMCNHCPYVIATRSRINQLAKDYAAQGVSFVGISSNDAERYPSDGFEEMKTLAQKEGFAFPYLYDETQEVAKAYGAVCTPEFYAYSPESVNNQDRKWILKYLGRLDDSWKDEKAVTRRELAEALDQILKGENPSADQKPALGCSIKWKEKAHT